ncbi:MAG: hypothetical protein R3343_09610 [Nitriliruptorales bacterium]|nr:hypothetical protein [Nitriliruptorales bacterium]
MSIDRLPSGNWRARVMVARQRYTATFPTRDEAEEWLLLKRAKAVTGELLPRMSVEQFVHRWLDSPADIMSADRDRQRSHLERYVVPRLGRCELAKVIPSDVSLLLSQVAQQATPETADDVHRTCTAIFDAAVEAGFWIARRSPLRMVEVGEYPSGAIGSGPWPSTLVDGCRSSQLAPRRRTSRTR